MPIVVVPAQLLAGEVTGTLLRGVMGSRSTLPRACVQVATPAPLVAVRDSKDRQGPTLAVSSHDWQVFVRRIKTE